MLYGHVGTRTFRGSVSIVRKFDSPKIQLKLKLALILTLNLTDTGNLRTIEPMDYRADTHFGTKTLRHQILVPKLGTCEASRFDLNSNRTIHIRFESDGLIRNFRISRTCRRTTTTLTVQQKLQPLRRCNLDYFMFMILCLCSKSIHTRWHCRSNRAISFEEPGESARSSVAVRL